MKVLIAPLDWGLGHATRCIPVIRAFMAQGCEVILAGSGDALALLQREYPALPAFQLPGYSPKYPERGSMVWSMVVQLPRFLRVIRMEHLAVSRIVAQQKIDLVVSDNRYGCRSAWVPSVFITHQSNILMPRRFGWLATPLRALNNRLMSRFDRCWIPDYPEGKGLAGELSQFDDSGVKQRGEYIGWLTRFERKMSPPPETHDILAVVSGPEPQRSVFEAILAPQLQASGLKYRLVRGLPASRSRQDDPAVIDFLDAHALQTAIETSRIIIARSGYSTVMDLQALGKHAIFVPTPGQTEQEYLADRLMKKGVAFSVRQDSFHLQTALERSKEYSGFKPVQKDALLVRAVEEIIRYCDRRAVRG